MDPKGKKAKKVSAAATGGFDDKGVIDWHYAMAELSRKNGVLLSESEAFGTRAAAST